MIQTFRRYPWLSNFHLCPVVMHNTEYPSAEHAYQALKFKEVCDRNQIKMATTPERAKRLAHRLAETYPDSVRDTWANIKVSVMRGTVMTKFVQNKDLGRMLLDTGEEVIVEGNHHHDNFWGNCTCEDCKVIPGKNTLGKILMNVRSILTTLRT